ncbi:MAG: hypothetical protein M1834_000131 [Cirrosporium novae-zelandiae]|nr:MAG: hypothetical protein M1834_000131 [Cirrosporium novae-zelandiae]
MAQETRQSASPLWAGPTDEMNEMLFGDGELASILNNIATPTSAEFRNFSFNPPTPQVEQSLPLIDSDASTYPDPITSMNSPPNPYPLSDVSQEDLFQEVSDMLTSNPDPIPGTSFGGYPNISMVPSQVSQCRPYSRFTEPIAVGYSRGTPIVPKIDRIASEDHATLFGVDSGAVTAVNCRQWIQVPMDQCNDSVFNPEDLALTSPTGSSRSPARNHSPEGRVPTTSQRNSTPSPRLSPTPPRRRRESKLKEQASITLRPGRVQKRKATRKPSKSPTVPKLPANQWSMDLDKPWVKINKSYGKNGRFANIIKFHPEEIYDLPSQIPTPWSSFTYNRFGEFGKRCYTAEELNKYLFQNPLHTRASSPKQSALTLWIQSCPTDSARRYCTPVSSRCRFAECPSTNNLIAIGQFRVAIDETSNHPANKNLNLDPFHHTGYVHLFCAERFLDFPKICHELNVQVDDRELKSEPSAKNKMQVRSSAEGEVAYWFLDVCSRFPRGPVRYSHYQTPNRPFENTLTHMLTVAKVNSESDCIVRQQVRRGLKGSHISVHLGNLEMWAKERGKTRKIAAAHQLKKRLREAESKEEQEAQPRKKRRRGQSAGNNQKRSSRKRMRVEDSDDDDGNFSDCITVDNASDDDLYSFSPRRLKHQRVEAPSPTTPVRRFPRLRSLKH